MNLETQFKIKNNPMLQKYIRENSYWYKTLNRNPSSINELIDEMKVKYKLTTADKINNISEKLDLIKTFMNVLK
jgi:hypothetical protein